MVLLDTAAMADLHMRWMDLPGPTDVMSFPMDELEPGGRPDAPEPGPAMLGDIVLCPEFAAEQAAAAGHTPGPRVGAADDPRRAAPARLRPRRAGRRKRDVRPAAPPARGVGRRSGRVLPPAAPARTRPAVARQVKAFRELNSSASAARRDRADLSGQRVRGHRRRDQHGVDGAGARAGSRRAARRGAPGQGDDRSASLHQPGGAAADHLRDHRDRAAGGSSSTAT